MRLFEKLKIFKSFLTNNKEYPIVAAIAAGLYPFFFYYSNNYALVNSREHLMYFVFSFLLVPILGFVLGYRLFSIRTLLPYRKYVLPFLNFSVFLFLLAICHFARIHTKASILALVVAALGAYFLHNYIKRIIILQFILAAIGGVMVAGNIYSELTYSESWVQQPDDIEDVIFKQKPNVYFIQPDGYVNFSELSQGYYKFENSGFEAYLNKEGFKNYDDFRSNYASTLSSNSSMFMMKHHYYGEGISINGSFASRDIIISKNTVLDVFKRNGYLTHFLTETPYLLLSRPEIGYHKSNFVLKDVPFISTGFQSEKLVTDSLPEYLKEDKNKPKFFFIEIFNPGHIRNAKSKSRGVEGERKAWLDNIEVSNAKLENIIEQIKENDPNPLIVILSDHGGYVGFEYAGEIYTKTTDESKIKSVFSTILSIHWPYGNVPEYDEHLETSVNIFRVLFSYLSKNQSYMKNMQDNGSYLVIKKGAPQGVYQYIEPDGSVGFKRLN
tara:strand:- start:61188 stop:62678 length:1491 start_codon:yes stop_codon:yes gene_type:complete